MGGGSDMAISIIILEGILFDSIILILWVYVSILNIFNNYKNKKQQQDFSENGVCSTVTACILARIYVHNKEFFCCFF